MAISQTYLAQQQQGRGGPSGLADVLEVLLDKGLVIDAFVRVSLVGIELLTIDARIVVASVDTYLRYAREAEHLQIYKRSEAKKLPDAMGKGMTGSAVSSGAQQLGQAIRGDDDDDDDDKDKSEKGGRGEDKESHVGEKLAHGVRHVLTKGVGKIMGRMSGDDRYEDDDKDDEGGEEREQRHHRPEQRRHAGGKGNSGKGQPDKAGAKR